MYLECFTTYRESRSDKETGKGPATLRDFRGEYNVEIGPNHCNCISVSAARLERSSVFAPGSAGQAKGTGKTAETGQAY